MNFTKINEDIEIINSTIKDINGRLERTKEATILKTVPLLRQPPRGLLMSRGEIAPIAVNVKALVTIIVSYSQGKRIKDFSASEIHSGCEELIRALNMNIGMLNANMSC